MAHSVSPLALLGLWILGVVQVRADPDSLVLVRDGTALAAITIDRSAPTGADSAARVLQAYLDRISGAHLTLSPPDDAGQRRILFQTHTPAGGRGDLGEEGFRILRRGDSLIFCAQSGQGLQNAVYAFLESTLGCRYYARDAQVIPRRPTLRVGNIDQTHIPAFRFRVPYYGEAFEAEYIRWHRLSNAPRGGAGSSSVAISRDWGLWVHTLHRLVPPDSFFQNHPEYFALRGGLRLQDQLCLSDTNVLEIACASLGREMRANPSARYWSVSQMDNYSYCECDRCRRVDSLEGSPSGSIVRFANAVAARFPDKVISTLAYQYSRKPPRLARPRANVNIMLCTIECDRSRPIDRDTSQGSFWCDLRDWAAISRNILVWDYVINFSHIVAPFPNLHVLKPNLQLFRDFGVSMVFEQGWPSESGEMEELRCYLLAKLLWDPDADVGNLTEDFLDGYYGRAGPWIGQMLRAMERGLAASGRALTLYEPPSLHATGYLSPECLRQYGRCLDRASEAVANDSVRLHRVEMVRQSLRYAWLEVSKSKVFSPDWAFEPTPDGSYAVKSAILSMLHTFAATARRHGPSLLHETGNAPEEYERMMTEYYARAIVKHLARGKQVTFASPPAPQYSSTGPGTVTDGVLATEQYQLQWLGWEGTDMVATIDLGGPTVVRSVEVRCLDDNMSWIMEPERITVEVSPDGVDYRTVSVFQNPQARTKMARHARILAVDLPGPVDARFVRVTASTIGSMPAWRGVNGDAWVFVDEIIVR